MLKFLKSGCILGDRWSSEQLGTMRFGKIQEMRDVFAGVLLALAAVGQPQAHFLILKETQLCASHGRLDGEVSNMHSAEVHAFSDSV